MTLKPRIQKLEALLHDRLAAAAAQASLSLEEPQSLEELHRLDAGTLTDMCMDIIQGSRMPDTQEFHQAYTRYRSLSFLQLARLFPGLMRRRHQQRAQRDRKLAARQSQARAELAQPGPDLTAGCAYDDQYQHTIAYRRLLSSLCWQ